MSNTTSRRTFLKTVGVGAGAAVGLGATTETIGPPVGDARAFACGGLCVGAIAAGTLGAAGVGWMLRETETIGSNPPADGLTAPALRQQVYDSAKTRKSTNQSMFVDNQNIIGTGFEDSLYTEGKIAAMDAITSEKTESEVLTAAQSSADAQESTVKANVVKSWNESANELQSFVDAGIAHADVSDPTTLVNPKDSSASGRWQDPATPTRTMQLPDGTDQEVVQLAIDSLGGNSFTIDPFQDSPQDMWIEVDRNANVGETFQYLTITEWVSVWDKIEQAATDVQNGLATWVSNTYGQVQSGDIDPGELLTSRELAAMTETEDGSYNRAISDLMAMNVPVNLEREATITLQNDNTTLYGQLAVSDGRTVSTGTTIEPSTVSATFYLTYDVSQGHGTWSNYQEGVDGGTVTFTSEPEDVVYQIKTSAGETIEVNGSSFTDQGDGTWTVDASDKLETAITNITEVTVFPSTTQTDYQTIVIDQPFVVEEFTDSEGNTYDETTYEPPSTPQDDTNYITQEEWEQRESRYRDLIEKYEESQNGGAGGGLGGNGGLLVGVLAALGGGYLLTRGDDGGSGGSGGDYATPEHRYSAENGGRN